MIFTTELLFYHTSLIFNNISTKNEIKHYTKNPFGNKYSRSKSMNFKQVLFPQRPKKTIFDIFYYNESTYLKQQKYKNRTRNRPDSEQSKETEINLTSEISFQNIDDNPNSKSQLTPKLSEKIEKQINNEIITTGIENENDINNKEYIISNEKNEKTENNDVNNKEYIIINEKNEKTENNDVNIEITDNNNLYKMNISSKQSTFNSNDFEIKNTTIYRTNTINIQDINNDINCHEKSDSQL